VAPLVIAALQVEFGVIALQLLLELSVIGMVPVIIAVYRRQRQRWAVSLERS
jgi:hypothetical protein